MSDKKVLSFAQIETVDDAEYVTVPGWGGQEVTLGSVSAEDLLDWIEENEDEEKRKKAGLRLLVKALVEGVPDSDPKAYKRIPTEDRDKFVAIFMKKNPKTNGRLVAEALKLNGMEAAAKKTMDAVNILKNGSGEANPDASPTGSASPQVG